MSTPVCWIGGRVAPLDQARISPADRGLTLGDGVFETILLRAGRLIWAEDHLSRLRGGAAVLKIPVPMDDAAILDGLRALAAEAELTDAAIRLTLTRGEAAQRGLWPPGEPVAPVLYATIAPRAAASLSLPPVRMMLCASTRRNADSPLSRIKSLAYGDAVLARQEAAEHGAQEAVLLNTRGELACASAGNVFLELDGGWVTPSLETGILPGLARARLIPLLQARERILPADALLRAIRIAVVNSLGCTPVASLGAGEDARPLAADLPFDTDVLYRCVT